MWPSNVICLIKWYNNGPNEQELEKRGLLTQVDDETGRHYIDENAHHDIKW